MLGTGLGSKKLPPECVLVEEVMTGLTAAALCVVMDGAAGCALVTDMGACAGVEPKDRLLKASSRPLLAAGCTGGAENAGWL